MNSLIIDVVYDLIVDYDEIQNNIIKLMQYYLLEPLDLNIKQLLQLYLQHAYEFRVGELVIIRNRNLNIDPILLSRTPREVFRNNFSWKPWSINSVDKYIAELVIDYNNFFLVRQQDEYNWNNKRIRCKYNPPSNRLIRYTDQCIHKFYLK